jgi:RNA recognition motif-containing protein
MNRGFAFITFESEKSVKKALNYDEHQFYKRKIKICVAKQSNEEKYDDVGKQGKREAPPHHRQRERNASKERDERG